MFRIVGFNRLCKKIILAIVVRPIPWITLFRVVRLAKNLELAFSGFPAVNADAVRPLNIRVLELTAVDMIDGELLCGTTLSALAT
jgi:hypothetical protein